MRRQSNTTEIWRVRGYNGDEVRHSRIYQREAAAVRNYRACWDYYDHVTIESADIGEFTVAQHRPWWGWV